jgi:hypothetical protein
MPGWLAARGAGGVAPPVRRPALESVLPDPVG